VDDDKLIKKFVGLIIKKDGACLKHDHKMIPFLHMILRCEHCKNVFFYHAPVMGDKEFVHAMIGQLPKVATLLLKSAKCPVHGTSRYVGYVFTALAKMWETGKKKPSGSDKYIVMSVTTKKSSSTVFKITDDKKLVKHKELEGGEIKGPMVNIFTISHWETDDPMFR
jgi:hypothetical protein